MTTSITAFPITAKQIAELTSASSAAGTDFLMAQQGTTGTAYRKMTVAQLKQANQSVTISAAGTTQGTATVIAAQQVVVTTVASGTGVKLADYDITIMNRGANDLKVYPPSGAQIEAYGSNVAVTIPTSGSAEFWRVSSTQFYVR